ncbi:hypothetical protein Rhopal_001468-T1 [Rhodotorula paludigena]|uniref:Proteophosphoglycan ppg4 n=1 Tax=Rhodotorula paludigena TaxID=86838 RepID=A0AAV5GGI8_9BASI|nr:hypothetical protein Rhopal_001468-T1 [Rhodotorula paludigena]
MAAALFAASPAVGGSSPNSPAVASPAPLRTSPRKAKAAASPSKRSPRKERVARRDSALGAKDANGDGSLLVDFGDDCAVSNAEAVFPRTPSAFARSLLDKTPSLLKAQLSTPLIPLGTPVTTRKGRTSSPSKENATPTTRHGARRLDHSPSPSPANSPASTPSVPSSSAHSVRYSPSPRRLRSSPRKPALGAPVHVSASPATPPSYASASPARSSPLATPLHRVGLATPSHPHPLATASPFPLFSPSTPATRTHASYREDELTDCDADGSIYDLDEEERSMSYPPAAAGMMERGQSGDADDQVDAVADAVCALSLAEQPVLTVSVGVGGAISDDTVDDGENEGDSLDELTETELATSASEDEAGDEEDAMDPSAELDGAAGVTDVTGGGGEIEDSTVEDDSAAMGNVVGEDFVLTGVDEDSRTGPTLTCDLEGAREADEEHAAIEADDLLVEAPTTASSIEVEPFACGDDVVNDEQVSHISPEPSASEGTAVASEDSASVGVAEEIVSLAPTSPTSEFESPLGSFSATQGSVGAAVEQLATPQPPSPSEFLRQTLPLAPSTPSSALPSLRFTSPATPPAPLSELPLESSVTPDAFKTAKVQVTDAPTARRQLTKLTSVATARAVSANAPGSKATLTSLIPGSAAASSRRLPASRLALPKRTALPSTIAEASPAPLPQVPAIGAVGIERIFLIRGFEHNNKAQDAFALWPQASWISELNERARKTYTRIVRPCSSGRSGSEADSLGSTAAHSPAHGSATTSGLGSCGELAPRTVRISRLDPSRLDSFDRTAASSNFQLVVYVFCTTRSLATGACAHDKLTCRPFRRPGATSRCSGGPASPGSFTSSFGRRVAEARVRARRTRATEAEVLAAAAPTVTPTPLASIAATTRTTRRAAAAAAPSARAQPLPPPVAPVARSARRPTRREPSIEETPAEPTPPAAAQLVEEEPLITAAPVQPRAAPHFHAAPAVTQDELNRLTQRNTKKNQQPFNKLKLETVYLNENRPASPTSKIRKSFGSAGGGALEQASTKEGREARAAKRRNALRASADGSELEAFAAELRAENDRDGGEDETAPLVPRAHFRAAGDDEQYETPLRGPTTLKSKAAAAKKRSSASSAGAAEGEPRRVRWDRALVYEGPREGETPVPDSSILKPSELDDWGNSTVANASLGKAVPVLIRMRVFKDDE